MSRGDDQRPSCSAKMRREGIPGYSVAKEYIDKIIQEGKRLWHPTPDTAGKLKEKAPAKRVSKWRCDSGGDYFDSGWSCLCCGLAVWPQRHGGHCPLIFALPRRADSMTVMPMTQLGPVRMLGSWKKKPIRRQRLIHPNRIEYLLMTCDAQPLSLARQLRFCLRFLGWCWAQHSFGRSEGFGEGSQRTSPSCRS
jgi:hypothetical protein